MQTGLNISEELFDSLNQVNTRFLLVTNLQRITGFSGIYHHRLVFLVFTGILTQDLLLARPVCCRSHAPRPF
jgi:hypothetical protein